MLTAEKIRELLAALNEELEARNVVGEIGLCGGAVMCLVFKVRPATKDVAGIFEPTREIRAAAAAVAQRLGIPEDWLNDAAKGFFLSDPPRIPVLELDHLRVWAPTAEYMLAMKCVSARFDTHDRTDVEFLIRHLGIESADAVLDIICAYYPRERIPPKAQFLVEELFE
jgi:hypothetical protein